MEKGYPRLTVDEFPGISQRVDAVFQHKGKLNELLSKISLVLKILSSEIMMIIIAASCKRQKLRYSLLYARRGFVRMKIFLVSIT